MKAKLYDHTHRQAGSNNPNWKGGRTVTKAGYVLVSMPTNPMADCRGYVYEHRLVGAEIKGRPLLHGEIAHHGNEIKSDNDHRNIEVCASIAEHKTRHRKPGTKVQQMPGEPNPLIVCACGCGANLLKYDKWRRVRKFVSGHNLHHG